MSSIPKCALSLVAALSLALSVVGCGSGQPEPLNSTPPSPEALRVLPTNAAAVDYVLDLVGPGRVAALPATVDEFSNVEVDPKIFGPDRRFKDFSAEVLLGFDPDLVIVSPWQGQDTIDRLRGAGVEVLELTPVESLDDIRDVLDLLGRKLGAERRAAQLREDFDRRVATLEAKSKSRDHWTAVSYTNYGSGGWAAGSGTTAGLVMNLAGLQNRAAMAGRVGHDTVNLETLLAWDPDWIVVSKPSDNFGATRAFLEGEPTLKSLRCLKRRRIAEVPANLYSTTSHYLVRAAEALALELDQGAAK